MGRLSNSGKRNSEGHGSVGLELLAFEESIQELDNGLPLCGRRFLYLTKGTDLGSALGAALKAVRLAGENPVPGIAYLPG